jgi:hypothetical protein
MGGMEPADFTLFLAEFNAFLTIQIRLSAFHKPILGDFNIAINLADFVIDPSPRRSC